MKTKSTFAAFIIKALLTIFIMFGLSYFTVCNAQSSLVGKWKEVSTKQFFNAETAKKMGKASVQYPMRPKDVFIWELKADNTYTMTDGSGKDTKTTGEWSVKGDQLTIRAAAEIRKGMVGSHVYTYLISGNTLVRTMITQPPYNETVAKTEDTMIRM